MDDSCLDGMAVDGCSAALSCMYSREFNKHFSTGYNDVDDDDGDFMFMSNFISILKKKEGKKNLNIRCRSLSLLLACSLADLLIYVACLVGFIYTFNDFIM